MICGDSKGDIVGAIHDFGNQASSLRRFSLTCPVEDVCVGVVHAPLRRVFRLGVFPMQPGVFQDPVQGRPGHIRPGNGKFDVGPGVACRQFDNDPEALRIAFKTVTQASLFNQVVQFLQRCDRMGDARDRV